MSTRPSLLPAPSPTRTSQVLVLGGGAAGLFCAATAGQRQRTVTVLEHNTRPGNKILISGGGRCNFTNLNVTPDNYITQGSPDFVRSALAGFRPRDFLDRVEARGIAWHEKHRGQLFCDRSSREILDLLLDDCRAGGVELVTGCRILEVQCAGHPPPTSSPAIVRDSALPPDSSVPEASESPAAPGSAATPVEPGLPRWRVLTSQGLFAADSLVVATGGLSFPKLGISALGHDIARQFGLELIEPRPGLVPLNWPTSDAGRFGELSGISFEVGIRVAGKRTAFIEDLLFTHRGLSGPAALQASNYWLPGDRLQIDLLPGEDATAWLDAGRKTGRDLRSLLRGRLPDRFADRWCQTQADPRPVSQWSRQILDTVAARLRSWELVPSGYEGYPRAEVTVGGVATRELSSKTLECRRVPGLYFIGEVVDVTGWLGGYNFQWAWSSGHAAGRAV